MLASTLLRAEARPTSVPLGRRIRSLVTSLLAAATTGGSDSWPPVDVVVVESATGLTLRVWHEGGGEAARLLQALNDDLASMDVREFVDKWDVPFRA